MRFDKTSAIAFGLAGTATANWADWASSSDPIKETTTSTTAWKEWTASSEPVDPTSTSSSNTPEHSWVEWSSSSHASKSGMKSTPADSTKPTGSGDGWSAPTLPISTVTVTEYSATTTVHHSAFFVGPGGCTETVYLSTCGAFAPTSPQSRPADNSVPDTASSSPADGSWVSPTGAAPTASKPADGGWQSGSSPDDDSKTKENDLPTGITYTGGVPTGGVPIGGVPTGSWDKDNDAGSLNPGISSGSIIGTNSEVYSWTSHYDPKPTVSAASTYAGWGDWHGSNGTGTFHNGTGSGGSGSGSGLNGTGPALGSDASNVTAPFEPLKETGCNDASDRSKWWGKYSIDTDYYSDGPGTGKICSAAWEITNTTLNYDGVDRLALAINGQVPGPLLECNWGDTIEISVTNKLQDNATTIHWHGMTQQGTNDQDGVPGVTECAVAPGGTRTYTMKATSYGTGWYHSHLLSQYGDGVRGPMVIHGPATANYDVDAGTVMIDDLFGDGPDVPLTVAATNARIAHFGPGGTWNYMLNGANTFPDLSKGKHALWKVKSGQKYLFRLINSASQNMYSVHFDNHEMTVIATDYVPINPYQTEWLNIGIGQRYDVIVEMNQPTTGYFLRAVTQTGCPSACVNNGLGNANGIFLYEGADATLPTSTAGGKTDNDFQICADEPLASIVPYIKKSAGTEDAFKASASQLTAGLVATIDTPDDGTVVRWFINNGAINVDFLNPTLQTLASGKFSNETVSNFITLNVKNQWVYFVIQNQFFAAHPMHLHGHDMSILGQGNAVWDASMVGSLNFDNPARRDTAMLAGSNGPSAPPGYTVIGFETDNPGAWLMHCHISGT